jgi:hypothetical protein
MIKSSNPKTKARNRKNHMTYIQGQMPPHSHTLLEKSFKFFLLTSALKLERSLKKTMGKHSGKFPFGVVLK